MENVYVSLCVCVLCMCVDVIIEERFSETNGGFSHEPKFGYKMAKTNSYLKVAPSEFISFTPELESFAIMKRKRKTALVLWGVYNRIL